MAVAYHSGPWAVSQLCHGAPNFAAVAGYFDRGHLLRTAMTTDRLAIVVFNLGGPDGPAAVRPFLFNLFNDPAIVGLPQPFRWLLAQFISRTRAPKSRRYYAALGGGS